MEKYRILIADPDATTREAARMALEAAGHVIVAEADAADATRAAVAQNPVEALLIDADLLIALFRAEAHAVAAENGGKPEDLERPEEAFADTLAGPIVAIAASLAGGGSAEDLTRVASAGAFGTVTRPLRAEELLSSVAVAVQRWRDLHDCNDSVGKLQTRLADRIIIERAKGLLMQRDGLTEDEAFKRIHFTARRENRTMRAVAEEALSQAATPAAASALTEAGDQAVEVATLA